MYVIEAQVSKMVERNPVHSGREVERQKRSRLQNKKRRV